MDIKDTIQELCDKIRLFTIKGKELADKYDKDLKENEEWFLSEYKIIEEWFSLEKKIIGRQLECLQNLLKDKTNEKIREFKIDFKINFYNLYIVIQCFIYQERL